MTTGFIILAWIVGTWVGWLANELWRMAAMEQQT